MVLWAAMLLAVIVLGGLALRELKGYSSSLPKTTIWLRNS